MRMKKHNLAIIIIMVSLMIYSELYITTQRHLCTGDCVVNKVTENSHNKKVPLKHDEKRNSSFISPGGDEDDLTIPSAAISSGGDDLTIPSAAWTQDRYRKVLRFLSLEYKPPNQWMKCDNTYNSLYFPNIHAVFTGVPKSGCSNWLEAILRAEGGLNSSIAPNRVNIVHRYFAKRFRVRFLESKRNLTGYDRETVENSFSFAVVRNPWTRMVSGYRDKISAEKTQGLKSKNNARLKILNLTRNFPLSKTHSRVIPTFEEYLRWILQSDTGDYHFDRQVSTLCIPHVMYDIIVPLEHSLTMSDLIWTKINASSRILRPYDQSSDPRIQSSTLFAKQWFLEVDKQLIERLYERFKPDFMLMNYSNFTHPDFPLPLID